jgi:integrase/recombinase XerD
MLHSLLPRVYRRFLSLPLLGPIADGFDDWLAANGYTRISRGCLIRMLKYVDTDLRRRHVKEVGNLTHAKLNACWRDLMKVCPTRAGTVRTLERYLAANALIVRASAETPSSAASILVEEYVKYLHEVRGLAPDSLSNRRHTAHWFLRYLDKEGIGFKNIRRSHLESYVTRASKRLCGRSLQNDICRLRVFLRFLALDGRVPAGLDRQIDTPRLYRLQRLPHALPWETVSTLLRSIDRTSAIGLRDYAMFLLIATYGLRAGEVVTITLDDVHWRQSRLRIHQRKTLSSLELPLTNEVSTALVKHLKRTPPPPPHRRIFLRMRAPIGVLKATAVTEVFQSVVRKSGLSIPFQGPHCIRHSLATHLLKNGTPLKTIGDILGHRSTASTSTYLRLATGDLREVSLAVPGRERQVKEEQR